MKLHTDSALERIRREAAHWVAERAAGQLSADAQLAFRTWRATSPQHDKAYEETENVWRAADALSTCTDFDFDGSRARRKRRVAVSVLLVAFTFFGGLFQVSFEHTTYTQISNYVTQNGDQRTVELPDGSRIELNTNTRLTVHLTRDARAISLLQGSALFRVAHEENRPFDVIAGTHTVRATGTEFSVLVSGAWPVDLLVVSGEVVLDPLPAPRLKLLAPARNRVRTFRAGDHVIIKPDGRITQRTLTQAEMKRELLWRKGGVIEFDGERLEDVLATINRFNRIQIRLDEPELLNTRIGATLTPTNVEEFINAISLILGLRVDPTGADPDEIHLVRDERAR